MLVIGEVYGRLCLLIKEALFSASRAFKHYMFLINGRLCLYPRYYELFLNCQYSKWSRNLLSPLTCFLYQKDVYLWQLIRMSFKPSIDHSTPTLNAYHYFYWLYNKIKICSEILIFTLIDCSFYIDCLAVYFILFFQSKQNGHNRLL